MTQPKVSCIVPTSNRSDFIPDIIETFNNQLYKNKELVIVADFMDDLPDLSSYINTPINFIITGKKLNVGKKRNIACENSSGDIIVHLDDDDWYSPNWIDICVDSLKDSYIKVAGTSSLRFYDTVRDEIWLYHHDYILKKKKHRHMCGATLAYRKEIWEHHQFQDLHHGEDTAFIRQFHNDELYNHAQVHHVLSCIHNRNTCKKMSRAVYWKCLSVNHLKLNTQLNGVLNSICNRMLVRNKKRM